MKNNLDKTIENIYQKLSDVQKSIFKRMLKKHRIYDSEDVVKVIQSGINSGKLKNKDDIFDAIKHTDYNGCWFYLLPTPYIDFANCDWMDDQATKKLIKDIDQFRKGVNQCQH